MKLNYHKSHRGGGQSQALHNVSFFNNLPEPSLWNSQTGRREFLGKVGKASVGTAIVLNGLKLEVMASDSTAVWKIAPNDGTYTEEAPCTGTNYVEDGVTYRFSRSAAITFTKMPTQNAYGTSATNTITVKVTVQKQKKVDNIWVSEGAASTATYSRTVTATIDSSGDVTFTVGGSPDHTDNGVGFDINPGSETPVKISGPSDTGLGSDTMDPVSYFLKKLGTATPTPVTK